MDGVKQFPEFRLLFCNNFFCFLAEVEHCMIAHFFTLKSICLMFDHCSSLLISSCYAVLSVWLFMGR